MRLVAVTLEGLGRFAEKAKINLDAKLIAIVGPNEAGKSTILDALDTHDSKLPIPFHKRTRGSAPPEDAPAIEAQWLIETRDLEEIDVPEGSEPPRWLVTRRNFDGTLGRELIPTLHRPRKPRKEGLVSLQELSNDPEFLSLVDAPGVTFDRSVLEALSEGLQLDSEDLDASTRKRIEMLADVLEETDRVELAKQFRDLVGAESSLHPDQDAQIKLWRRTPDVVRFDLESRSLDSSYDLSAIAENPPPGLRNLATLTNLDLVALRDAAIRTDRGAVAEILDDANAKLATQLAEAWGQSAIEVRLVADNSLLSILVRTGRGGLQDIAQRSDGLRAFIALVAFTSETSRHIPPILTVDEAEIHLHYDAQADLVQMLSAQRQASQVIYTTHSAGCLPQDLGTGVRMVVPAADVDRSHIENWPWRMEGGFAPLLLGLGASTMAFVPTRAAVIAEGATEVVLLPTLIRECMRWDVLPFQIAPGAAEATRATVSRIDLQGARVIWLVDGDEGGAANRRHLERSGIPAERIRTLGGDGVGLTTEDLLDPAVLAAAVESELRRSHGSSVAFFRAEDLPETGRAGFIREWCTKAGIPEPNKGAVAHRVAERRSETRLLSGPGAVIARSLVADLLSALQADPPPADESATS